ncbi:MFS transporter [Chitinophagaceae bacterium LB-8]|uniref:MFS transporter n=1 Tax=Paraflavisolibacter caeni TaxID=2982496 RepID=A0A9X2XVJ0_9BACT|nr:MFS transporter [Paraflavisolibacter caeni]MCU7549765.1 MFS transporter [Paraflavisolibacter caeni]
MIESQTIAHPISTARRAGLPQALVVILINMLPMMAIIALVPVVPAIMEYFKDVPNINTLAPLVLAAPGLCVALLSPFAGYLADKLGRRNLLLFITFLYGIGGVMPFFIHSFSLLFASRLLLGIGEAFILTIGNTLWGDYFEPKERAKWIVIQSVTGTFLATLLLSFSGYLASFGWQYPFLIYSISFITLIATYLFIFEPHIKNKDVKFEVLSPTRWPVSIILTLCITTLITSIIYFAYTLHFSLVLDAIGIKNQVKIGNYSAIASIGAPVGALMYKLVAKRSIHYHLALMGFFYAVGLTGIGFAQNEIFVVIAAFITQLGIGLTIPVLVPWSLQLLPAEFRGRGMGFWTTAFFLGQFISPLVVSGVRSLSGSLLNAFMVLGILCLVMAILNLFFSTKRKL